MGPFSLFFLGMAAQSVLTAILIKYIGVNYRQILLAFVYYLIGTSHVVQGNWVSVVYGMGAAAGFSAILWLGGYNNLSRVQQLIFGAFYFLIGLVSFIVSTI